jgi:transcription antitermination factor NusG
LSNFAIRKNLFLPENNHDNSANQHHHEMEICTEKKIDISSANVTDDREACSIRWYAARTHMNCERKAEREFRNIAIETYLPTQEEIHFWSDRKKKIQRIVIPMILFVKMRCDNVKNIHQSPYFYGFLGHNRHDSSPAPIPDRDIETLKFMLGQSDLAVEITEAVYATGDPVKVVRGPLCGIEGKIVSVTNGKGALIIPINCIGNAKVAIDLNDIEHFNNG